MTIEEAIERVERMLAGATPGPWRWEFEKGSHYAINHGPQGDDELMCAAAWTPDDAELIAQSRTFLPAMLEVVRRAGRLMEPLDDFEQERRIHELATALNRFTQEVGE